MHSEPSNLERYTAPLHSTLRVQPLCANQSPCTVHRTQQPGRYFLTKRFPGPRRMQGVGHRKGDPAGQEAIVCHHSAIRGQDNNLLVAMKQEVCAKSLLAVKERKRKEVQVNIEKHSNTKSLLYNNIGGVSVAFLECDINSSYHMYIIRRRINEGLHSKMLYIHTAENVIAYLSSYLS